MIKVLLSILGAIAGLLAALFVADHGVRTARKYRRNYIKIDRDQYH